MRIVPLGSTDIQVPNIVAGMMRIAGKSDEHIRALYAAARENGVTYFDHADLYGFNHPGGGPHLCEERFAGALQLSSAEREEIVLQTKTSIVDGDTWHYDQSYEHIVESVDRSLRALGTDYIDVLLLHRPDALVEPEEVARAFDDLEAAGKVRHFGVSNHTPGQIELLRTAVRQNLVANQLQLSLTHANLVAQGLVANMNDEPGAVSRDNGLLDYSRIHRMTIQAWSPFQRGFGGGVLLGNPELPELNTELERLAAKYDVTPTGIATAWITRHPAHMQVVLGTTTPSRIAEAVAGSDLPLTRPEWYGLLQKAGHRVP